MLKKSSSKFISIKIILLIIGFLIFFMLAYITAKYINPEIEKELNEVNNVYYSKFNETFLGIIISIQDERRQFKGGPHLAMLKLKLLHTTVKNYDIRDSTMNYFCVINYPYAEVFCHTGVSRNIELGDTCYYNGKNDTLWIFSNKENIWLGCRVEINNSNIKEVKKHHTIPIYTKEKIELMNQEFLKQNNNFYMLLVAKYKNIDEYYKISKEKGTYGLKKDFNSEPYFTKKIDGIGFLFFDNRMYYSYKKALSVRDSIGYSKIKIMKLDDDWNILNITDEDRMK